MKQKLEWLEFGRGIAALAVVLCHVHWYLVETPDYLHFLWPWGDWAVKFFFVLSGFIIYFVNGHEIGCGSPLTFALRRFVRIFPTYWLIFLAALALRQYAGNAHNTITVTTDFLATNLFLLPTRALFINAAWSLRHEVIFYAVFLVCIWNARIGLAIASAWLVAVLASFAEINVADDLLLTTLSNPVNLLFAVGIALAIISQRFQLSKLLADGPPLSAWLGRISYPLYLCHMPVFLIAHGLLKRVGRADDWIIASTFGILLSVGVADMIARYFERPILRKFSKLGRTTPPSPATSDRCRSTLGQDRA